MLPVSEKRYTVLFLCTGNSARSILAEAMLNHLGGGRFIACSAGSHPKSRPHPLALATLQSRGLPIDGLRNKSWEEFTRPGALPLDFIFTLCDDAATEPCPVWPPPFQPTNDRRVDVFEERAAGCTNQPPREYVELVRLGRCVG